MTEIKLPHKLDYTITRLTGCENGNYLLESKKYSGVLGAGPTIALAEKNLRENIKIYKEMNPNETLAGL